MTDASRAAPDGAADDCAPGRDAIEARSRASIRWALARTLQPRAGEYAVDGLDGLRWRGEKTVIRDAQGNPVQTIG
ncbi:hypothetical protein [Burkholderia sp. Ac-20344]|uniref:hypothetical protein n=1 Tax=Burkholderia sp. Ac-20344 TaxID=2703890 RepID=UPI001F119CE0|nr:hypothetical protein [Burkholderia sp. Ac-20344]